MKQTNFNSKQILYIRQADTLKRNKDYYCSLLQNYERFIEKNNYPFASIFMAEKIMYRYEIYIQLTNHYWCDEMMYRIRMQACTMRANWVENMRSNQCKIQFSNLVDAKKFTIFALSLCTNLTTG
jgi:hypothetical protein